MPDPTFVSKNRDDSKYKKGKDSMKYRDANDDIGQTLFNVFWDM